MRRHLPAISVLALVGLLSVVVLVWAHPIGRDGSVLNAGWNGLSVACAELDGTPLYSYDELNEVEMPATLVVIPRMPVGTADVRAIGEFVEAGGTLLLLDDFGYGNEVLTGLGERVRFAGTLMKDSLHCYKDAVMPRVECLGVGDEGVLGELVLDCGTWLECAESTDVWARSSHFSYGDVDGDGQRGEDEPDGPFAIGVVSPRGRGEVVVISDSSVLLNGVVVAGSNVRIIEEFVRGDVMFDQVYLPDDEVDSGKATLNRVSAVVRSGFGAMILLLVLCSLAFSYACYNRQRQDND
ncbi:MAG: DUF4350 domain-containing protein [Dehalococcoidia bacterium]|nr:DUF4350 domain-containing protein [Dehalococcoidia bacterium]